MIVCLDLHLQFKAIDYETLIITKKQCNHEEMISITETIHRLEIVDFKVW